MALGYVGSDWQEEVSGDPKVREMNLASLYPHGTTHNDLLVGDHPFLAFGVAADKVEHTLVGVVSNVILAQPIAAGTPVPAPARVSLQTAGGAMAKIVNVLTYAINIPDTYDQSVEEGQVVYLDDSPSIADGSVTLSLSPLDENDAPNPIAGWIRMPQTGFDDSFVGGEAGTPAYPIVLANSETVFTSPVLLVGR